MNIAKSGISSALAILVPTILGCASQLDKKILALKQQVAVEQQGLSQSAGPYYAVQGKDFELEAGKTPVFDVLNTFNNTSRIIGVQSVGTAGWFAEFWTDCPIPLIDGKIGIYFKLAFPAAVQAVLYADPMTPSWTAGNGIDFPFNAVGGGGALAIGGAEFCFGSADITPIPVLAGFGSLNNHGRVDLAPVPDQGIQYEVDLDHKPVIILGAYAFGWWAGWPLTVDNPITQGTINNIVGKNGTVQITKIGEARNYSLNFNFDLANYVDGGLLVAGPIVITWQ
jgi:hypothetical protein